ncbi:NAD(P)-dependent oxidoreductase [Sodalis sp. RH14]|uniref:NAD(P)-dependent oxidoreductase n=1 Tax=Sodalis sp. RH14 TaxID=3394329 RepID=UPI0039B3EB4E
MLMTSNPKIINTKFALIGEDAKSTIPFLSHAGITSISYYHNYDEFNYSVEVDVVCLSGRDVVPDFFFEKLEKLSAVGLISYTNSVLDLHIKNPREIPVFSSNMSSVRSAAEYIIAAVFFILRNFHNLHIKKYPTYEVMGKTLGIVGYGKVGSQVSVLAEAVGMNVFFYDLDTKLNIGNAKQILSLPDLFSKSDIIVFTVPRSENQLLKKEELKFIKAKSSIINISGHNILDLESINHMLSHGNLSTFVMDVEPNLSSDKKNVIKSLFSQFDNILVTSGESYRTIESVRKISKEVIDNILSFLENSSIKKELVGSDLKSKNYNISCL